MLKKEKILKKIYAFLCFFCLMELISCTSNNISEDQTEPETVPVILNTCFLESL